ncbi:hypothetical protein GIB67_041644 [Kingdonia uniflora]|uniref:Uncharacterized protein n=1 Tax=Kingdonia uniflora TaxID=39325 RepID=A0A7J7MQM0_9MAGN|nr:hypothetical protein GIB67_041644 [Kingdonia uniflora]
MNATLVSIANRCKLLRKLRIDGWKTNRIGDEGLITIAKRCPNLQELVLIGVNPTLLSLGLLGANCQNLQRLALCASETIGDAEICCIASKCMALKKLCIKGCPISDHGMEALALGCPNLVKVKVKKCRYPSDVVVVENEGLISHSAAEANTASSSNGRSSLSNARLSFFTGKNFVACTFKRIWTYCTILYCWVLMSRRFDRFCFTSDQDNNSFNCSFYIRSR